MPPHRLRALPVAVALSLLLPAAAAASPYSDAQLARYPRHYLRLADRTGGDLGYPDGWPSGLRQPRATVGALVSAGEPGAIAGDADGALRFDGLATPDPRRPAIVTAPDYPYLAVGRFTWEAWLKPRTLDDTARRVLSSEDEHGGMLLAARRDGIVFARHLRAGSYRLYSYARGFHTDTLPESWTTLTYPIRKDRWTFVAAQFEIGEFDEGGYPTRRGVMRLFVDGALVAQRTTGVLPEPWAKTPLAIGSNKSGWLRFDGALDEIAEHSSGPRVSAAEILTHYRLGRPAAS